MGLDAGYLDEEIKKKKKLDKKVEQEQLQKIVKQQETKEKVHQEEVTHEELSHLKDLLEHHEIDDNIIQKVEEISQGNEINKETMQEILSMIDELTENEEQNKYIPEEFRITKDEYVHALHDDEQRHKTLVKLDNALWILAQHISPASQNSINISWMLSLVLDKNLVIAQESHIEIKRSLQNSDDQSMSLWGQIKNVFK